MLENCIFHISPMYEFSHSLGQSATSRFVRAAKSALASTPDIGERGWHVAVVPAPDFMQRSDHVHVLPSCRTSRQGTYAANGRESLAAFTDLTG